MRESDSRAPSHFDSLRVVFSPLPCTLLLARAACPRTINARTVDAAEFVRNLPHSIEAVFYLHEDCTDAQSGPKCEEYGRAAHARIVQHFGLSAEELPLLHLDPWRRDNGRPFSPAQRV